VFEGFWPQRASVGLPETSWLDFKMEIPLKRNQPQSENSGADPLLPTVERGI
jgi:hypothetical protein